MLEELKQQVYEANMELPRRSLVTYTWGNVSGIDREKGLSYFDHNEADYMDIIHCFIEQYGEQKTKLERFYEEKDWENYKIIVHSLKGQSLTIGAESLSEKAKHLQEAAQKKLWTGWRRKPVSQDRGNRAESRDRKTSRNPRKTGVSLLPHWISLIREVRMN